MTIGSWCNNVKTMLGKTKNNKCKCNLIPNPSRVQQHPPLSRRWINGEWVYLVGKKRVYKSNLSYATKLWDGVEWMQWGNGLCCLAPTALVKSRIVEWICLSGPQLTIEDVVVHQGLKKKPGLWEYRTSKLTFKCVHKTYKKKRNLTNIYNCHTAQLICAINITFHHSIFHYSIIVKVVVLFGLINQRITKHRATRLW